MFKYDFALSFAGKHRKKAERLATLLQREKMRVFYDKDEQADLWGHDLYQKFQKIYGQESRFFIPFISSEYLAKRWPRHELKQAQARDIKSDIEYILPLRIDDSKLPGLNDTTAYIDLRNTSIEEVAELCLKKLARDSSIRQLYLYLREKNPEAMGPLEAKQQQVLIRVATSSAPSLERLLAQVDDDVCHGSDHHNTLMNGGFGPTGCIACTDPEPHTTFSLTFSDKFYAEILA